MDENIIKITNQHYHKHLTDSHLAQVDFVAIMPIELWDKYIDKTSIDHQNLGRLRFMEICDSNNQPTDHTCRVTGRVSHGYSYAIEQDIFNAIMDSKGVK